MNNDNKIKDLLNTINEKRKKMVKIEPSRTNNIITVLGQTYNLLACDIETLCYLYNIIGMISQTKKNILGEEHYFGGHLADDCLHDVEQKMHERANQILMRKLDTMENDLKRRFSTEAETAMFIDQVENLLK